MAKTPEPAVATVTEGGFTFDTGLSIPAASRAPAEASETAKRLAAMPVGASFLEAVVVPENVAEAERDAVFKEKARTKANAVSGVIRRFKKTEAGAGKEFLARTVNDDVAGRGIRVWRIEPTAPAAAPAAAG